MYMVSNAGIINTWTQNQQPCTRGLHMQLCHEQPHRTSCTLYSSARICTHNILQPHRTGCTLYNICDALYNMNSIVQHCISHKLMRFYMGYV